MSLAVLAAIQASSAMVKLSFSGNIVSSFAQHRAYMPPSSHSYSSCTSCLPLNRQLHHGLLTRGLATDNDNFIHTNRTRPLMYSYYVREISLCVGASCNDAPKSCISPPAATQRATNSRPSRANCLTLSIGLSQMLPAILSSTTIPTTVMSSLQPRHNARKT